MDPEAKNRALQSLSNRGMEASNETKGNLLPVLGGI